MIYVVDLESVSTRYTCEWKTHVPMLLTNNGFDVTVIDGPSDIPDATTPGAFLNFGGTNIYKSEQNKKIAELFTLGKIKPNDVFVFTDAWHPGVIQLKYMSSLLNIPIKIVGLWHAGSYDKWDFLGRLIGDAPWVRCAERSFFHAIDHNCFASYYHLDILSKLVPSRVIMEGMLAGKVVRTGWPMEYLPATLEKQTHTQKRDLILFPHRLAPEKQVDIFRDLSECLPEYEFVVCQDTQLSKDEYHTLLGEAKLIFSANLQETLGISMVEGCLTNAIPMVPNRLSYSEMFDMTFIYPSDWTESIASYRANKLAVCARIREYMTNYESYVPLVQENAETLMEEYFSATKLIDILKS